MCAVRGPVWSPRAFIYISVATTGVDPLVLQRTPVCHHLTDSPGFLTCSGRATLVCSPCVSSVGFSVWHLLGSVRSWGAEFSFGARLSAPISSDWSATLSGVMNPTGEDPVSRVLSSDADGTVSVCGPVLTVPGL